jgi:hypothetical protein
MLLLKERFISQVERCFSTKTYRIKKAVYLYDKRLFLI